MLAKKIVYFLSFLLISSAVMYCAGASQTDSVSFHGVGVTVDLTYPEEARNGTSIWHNVTITANVALTLQNFTMVIYAPVDSNWQEVTGLTIRNTIMAQNEKREEPIMFPLPQNANGTLFCFIYINTTQSLTDYSSHSFYTTQVRALTYSELLVAHNELLENYRVLNNSYTELNQTYTALWISYNELWANYSTLSANYNSLNSSFNSLFAQNSALQSEYNALNSTYYSLQANYTSILANNNALQTSYNSLSSSNNALQLSYNSLIGIKNALQSDFNSLNSTYQGVRTSYALLGEAYDSLNRTYTALQNEVNDFTQRINSSESALNSDRAVMFIFVATVAVLIAFVIYLRQKKTEPYVVIRKETVAIEKEEKQ
jgi:predicted nuclease with TOPRIM domain